MKTIDDVIGIVVVADPMAIGVPSFYADATKLTGTPPRGIGKTEVEAKFDLLAKLFARAWRAEYGRQVDELLADAL